MGHPKSDEELWAVAQRGTQTAAASAIIGPAVTERMSRLVRDAIRAYRSIEKPYTDRDALLFVAALVANQDILDDIERVISDGQRAGQHFVR